MAYVKKDFQTLYEDLAEDLKKRLPGITDFEQGSVVRSLLETLAFEQAVFYEQLDYIYDSSFVNTATSTNLEKVVAILDIKRGEPDYALGSVVFYKDPTIDEAIIIPIGTLITTKDDPNATPQRKAYRTIEETVLEADQTEVTVKIQAESRGSEYATDRETIVIIPAPIEGITAVTNPDPLTFTGRTQETDEELRERAKKTLLAAGKASETSIEQALLALPNILDIKIHEPLNESGEVIPGVINVYVDGLTETNGQQLAQRLDEAKASGIYSRLKPAEVTEVSATLKLVPHENIIDQEISDLEDRVATVLKQYLESKRMGEAFSITQLTTEILQIKGVQDLDRYDITFRERTVLQNPPVIPANGIDSNLLEVKYLQGVDDQGAEQYGAPENLKAIRFSAFARFNVNHLRIAAGDKELPVQVQVKVKYPNETSKDLVLTKVRTELDALDFTFEEVKDENLPVSDAVFTQFQQAVNDYFQSCKDQLVTRIGEHRTDPLNDRHGLFLADIKAALGDFSEGAGQVSQLTLEEATVKALFYDQVSGQMKNNLKADLQQIINDVAVESLGAFPESDLFGNLVSIAATDLTAQIDSIRREISAINQDISNKRLELISGELTPEEKTATKTAISELQTDLMTKQEARDQLQNQLSNLTSTLETLVADQSLQVRTKLETLNTPAKLQSYVAATGKLSDFDLSLRLRTLTYELIEHYHQPIPVSFIEKPVFDYLWVYTQDLRIAGELKLDLPLTLTNVEKGEVIENVRGAINQVLYNMRPETDILLADLIEAAKSQKHVLGATLEKQGLGLVEDQRTALQLLPDRLTDDTLIVEYSEKVLLSETFFTIT